MYTEEIPKFCSQQNFFIAIYMFKNRKKVIGLFIGIFFAVFLISLLFSFLIQKEDSKFLFNPEPLKEDIVISTQNTVTEKQDKREKDNSLPEKRLQSVQNTDIITTYDENKSATLEINELSYKSTIENDTSVYDFMQKIKDKGEITFEEKNYTGMGKFIDEINGIRGNGEKYWIYYVNDTKAKIGISNYKINPGDVVSWRYEKETY